MFRRFLESVVRAPAFTVAVAIASLAPKAYGQATDPAPFAGVLKVFVDCSVCSSDTQQFLRTELTYIDFTRDRQDASLHVLVTTERTGSGGDTWALSFLGQREFQGVDDTLKFSTAPADTEESTRAALLRTLTLGFVPYVARTDQADKLSVAFSGAPKKRVAEVKDRWNSWVMSVRGEGWANGEESRRFLSIYGNLGADRITERWKISTGLRFSTSKSRFSLSDGVVKSTRGDHGGSTTIVKSLGEHWSFGGFASVNASTYSNLAFGWDFSPALEYNVFPYSESTRRQLRFLYRIGPQFARYEQPTVFDQTRETLGQQALEVTLDQKTKWGSTRVSIFAQGHLHDLGSNSLSISTDINWRLVKGLSIRTSAYYQRSRDQRSIPRQVATDEEILLQISQLQSGYSYYASFGLTYSFGATTNNVVNPRFGR
jgi:hypothetical protein